MIIYRGYKVTESGGQPVTRANLDLGTVEPLDIKPSQELSNHSSEFQWGYGGSGPTQLALAILLDATRCPQEALEHCQQFKEEFVSTWGESFEITEAEILEWVTNLRVGS
jgi:hypothetical protein